MRLAPLVAALVFICLNLTGADRNPYLKLRQRTKDGKIQFAIQNASGKPIVAYVVAVEYTSQDGSQSKTVHYGVYSGKDRFVAGRTLQVAELEARRVSGEPTILVDYVRLADGTTWGDHVTDEGKEVAARFKK